MAITTDATIVFFGTQEDLDSASAAVVDAAFSVVGDLTTWTDEDDAPEAVFILLATFSVAPDAGSVINLHMRPLNIVDTTSDAQTPSTTYSGGFVGSFLVDSSSTSEQILPLMVSLPSVETQQEYELYIENQAGQTISAGWSIQTTPRTLGPHA